MKYDAKHIGQLQHDMSTLRERVHLRLEETKDAICNVGMLATESEHKDATQTIVKAGMFLGVAIYELSLLHAAVRIHKPITEALINGEANCDSDVVLTRLKNDLTNIVCLGSQFQSDVFCTMFFQLIAATMAENIKNMAAVDAEEHSGPPAGSVDQIMQHVRRGAADAAKGCAV